MHNLDSYSYSTTMCIPKWFTEMKKCVGLFGYFLSEILATHNRELRVERPELLMANCERV